MVAMGGFPGETYTRAPRVPGKVTSNKGEPLPADIAQLVASIADFLGVTVADLFVADHTHECLTPGAYSIAYEGDYDWPGRYFAASYDNAALAPAGWLLEPGTGWYLAVYPEGR